MLSMFLHPLEGDIARTTFFTYSSTLIVAKCVFIFINSSIGVLLKFELSTELWNLCH